MALCQRKQKFRFKGNVIKELQKQSILHKNAESTKMD